MMEKLSFEQHTTNSKQNSLSLKVISQFLEMINSQSLEDA